MRWPEALQGWPHAEASRRISAAPHRWHVQEMGAGPTLLFLHGAGGASHSWRGVLPILAQEFHVIALDLPGHGLSQMGTRSRSGLTAMSEDLLRLCASEDWHPAAVIGHSAGGAVALRMAQLAPDRAPLVLGINPALDNFKGVAGVLFPIMAKALALTPFMPDLFARSGRQSGRVEALLEGTGSKIDAQGTALYRALVGDRDHVDGVLTMMANWSLDDLQRDAPRTHLPVRFLTGSRDATVRPEVARRFAARLPDAQVTEWEALGHLMHEEVPDRVVGWITDHLAGTAEATRHEKSPPQEGQALMS